MSKSQKTRTAGRLAVEKRMTLLYQIVSQTGSDLNVQLQQALKLTTRLLEMQAGIISYISDQEYTVKHHFAEGSGLENGQKFKLGNTPCSVTIQKQNILAINNFGQSEYEKHPCYEYLDIESYIGFPLWVEGELYGTLNFSSSKPKSPEFISADKKLIKLLGQWVVSILNRMKIEEKLQKSVQKYKLISTHSADVISLHDPDGTYRFVSPSVVNLLGYKPEELIGTHPEEYILPEDFEKARKAGRKHIEKENSNTIPAVQYRIRKKDGSYIWVESTVFIVTSNEGEIVNLQSVVREVTERKKLEMLFSQAQRMANIGGWELNLDNGELYWTDEVYRIHDLPINSSVDVEDAMNYFPGNSRDQIQEAIVQTVETGESYDLTLPFKTPDGVKKWVRAIGNLYSKSQDGLILRGTFQDVTIQKLAEERIKSQNKELKKLTETRDKLYSIIAHDLKGAFGGIQGMLELSIESLEDKKDTADEVYKLEKAQTAAETGHELLENLLDWIRLQTTRLQPHYGELYVPMLIQDVIEMMRSTAESKNISINPVFESGSIIVADTEMVATILRNLLSNAIKFSHQDGSITITLSENDGHIALSVRDYGIGIPDDLIPILFDPAKRPQRKGTNKEKGTGLGLLLIKEMIELHNGSIKVHSQDEGTEFTVYLPVSPEEPALKDAAKV